MRLLIHVAGESDLLLGVDDICDPTVRAERVRSRCQQVAAALAGPGGPAAAGHHLTTGEWADEHTSTSLPAPLLTALSSARQDPDNGPDLDVIVIGTRQDPPHPLDTLPIAHALMTTLNHGGLAAGRVRTATSVQTSDLREAPVAEALADHLDQAPRYNQALVTWGSGATALTMGALTAVSQAGIPWSLVVTAGPATAEIIDPLERLDSDPVAGVLVRWRMFAALDELASGDHPAIRLSDAQHHLVRRSAARHRAGLQAHDCAALRVVLADAVVRRDGTASLAVRRYLTRRYEELLAADQTSHPRAKDLLAHATAMRGGRTLGMLRNKIKTNRDTDPVIRDSVGLASYQSLFTPEFDAMQNIGRGSHTLRPPAAPDARIVGAYLNRYRVDDTGWSDTGLPQPPTAPPDSILAVWIAGLRSRADVGTVGQQLAEHGPPAAVRDYVGIDPVGIRSIVFGVPGEANSLRHADDDARRLRAAGNEAWPQPITADRASPDTDAGVDAVQCSIEGKLTSQTAALLLIPTGHKPHVLTLLRAMRRIGARHGIPLFVRQNADPPPGQTHADVHLWPALTGGDLALLFAAREALRTLELDVAWRLLAASAIDPHITVNARRLAAAFASRNPLADTQWPHQADPALTPVLNGRMLGLIAQRLALVADTLTTNQNPADQIRLLVLAADAMEASIAATRPAGERPGASYERFRNALRELASTGGPPAIPARILLLLNEARDRAPITHGAISDPDAVVAQAADTLARTWSMSATESADLPATVADLVHRAVDAATQAGLGHPDGPVTLLSLRQTIDRQIVQTMMRRNAGQRARTQPQVKNGPTGQLSTGGSSG